MIHHITLMELYLIETLRTNGITNEEIIKKVTNGDVESFKQLNEEFDFTELFSLAKAGLLEDILTKGYQVKFMTFTGLVNVLQLKFNKNEHEDYTVENFTITNLRLSEEEIATLTQMLSNNWVVTTTGCGIMIKPVAQPES